jgi:TrmH family RNA methyltransferase
MGFKTEYERAKKGMHDTVVIEGIHAFKHAARFGAEFVDVITDDKNATRALMARIATEADVAHVDTYAREISATEFREVASASLRTGIIAIARKPHYDIKTISDQLIVYIENSRDIDNVGAVVRVAAARGIGAVVTSGEVSPWHMMAIRAGAGLQWAVPVLHIALIDDIAQDRVIYACDADGVPMDDVKIVQNAILVFGTERDGISPALKDRADHIIAIPMQKGVSSLNLATSVAAVLYGGKHA